MAKIQSRKTSEQLYEAWVKRTAKAHDKNGGNNGAIFIREKGQDPVTDAINAVFQKAARRKVN
jgi:hypothetical protein